MSNDAETKPRPVDEPPLDRHVAQAAAAIARLHLGHGGAIGVERIQVREHDVAFIIGS
jgi:hypothetical protein